MVNDFRSNKYQGTNGNSWLSVSENVDSQQRNAISLVESAVSGDSEAFGEIYSLYLDKIYRYVFYQVRDKMIAEDVTEEIFVKAWKAIKSCKGKEQTFLPWLYRIAHNHVIDDLRSRKRSLVVDIEMVEEVSTGGLELEGGLEQEDLSRMIDFLPQNQRQVIILKFIEGFDNSEISQAMDKSEGAVRVLQMRALAKLRQKLSGEQQYK
ncbi:RNA polymerase sigma factor [Chloroflexota bacterium]